MEENPDIKELLSRLHKMMPILGLSIHTARSGGVFAKTYHHYSRLDKLANGKFIYKVEVTFDDNVDGKTALKKVKIESGLINVRWPGPVLHLGDREIFVRLEKEQAVVDEVNAQLAVLFQLVDSAVQILGPRRIIG